MVITSSPFYELHFYDHTGTRVLVLDGWDYLDFSQRINAPWNHQLRIRMSFEDDRVSFFRDTLVRDFILEVYRTDPFTGNTSRVYEGFHRTLVDQANSQGDIILTMYGTGFTHLITRRIVIPPAGEENDERTGVASTVMYAFLDAQAISPVDATRIMPGLSNDTLSPVGRVATYSARYTNLMTVIERLSEQGIVDFGIIRGAAAGEFVFSVRRLWGTDRRQDNAAGVVPTIFDMTFNNMDIPILSRNGDGEVTHVYVGGSGEGVARTIAEYINGPSETASPWNRHEAFVDARRETTSGGLRTTGTAYLNEHAFMERLQFNLLQTEGTRWIRDWELGDIVTSWYFTVRADKKIREVRVIVSAGEGDTAPVETISAEIEDV